MTDDLNKTHVRILVRTEPENGYPPEEWERLWAIPVENGSYRIDNIPFYAKDLSCDDIVEATPQGDEYIFSRVLKPSENSTIRVVIYNLDEEEGIRNNISSLGCSIEGSGTPGLIAVNVPRSAFEGVRDFLDNAYDCEKLDFEEGALR